jgi:DNA-directed RNA polymerase subunit beta
MTKANAHPNFSFAEKKRIRKSFGKQIDQIDIPNLLEIQLDSYQTFIGSGHSATDYSKTGLHNAFQSTQPAPSK